MEQDEKDEAQQAEVLAKLVKSTNEIILKGLIDSAPGISWSAELHIKVSNRNTELWYYGEALEQPVLIATIPDKPTWRNIIHTILASDHNYRLRGDYSNNHPFLTISGEKTFRGELYLLAWIDDSNHTDITSTELLECLLQLPDDKLASFYHQEGSFLSTTTMETLRSILRIPNRYKHPQGKPFPTLNNIHPGNTDTILGAFQEAALSWKHEAQQEEERKSTVRKQKLEPHADAINALTTQHRHLLAHSSGLGSTIGRQILHANFVRFIEDYIIEHGTPPRGQVKVHGVGDQRMPPAKFSRD